MVGQILRHCRFKCTTAFSCLLSSRRGRQPPASHPAGQPATSLLRLDSSSPCATPGVLASVGARFLAPVKSLVPSPFCRQGSWEECPRCHASRLPCIAPLSEHVVSPVVKSRECLGKGKLQSAHRICRPTKDVAPSGGQDTSCVEISVDPVSQTSRQQ